MNTATIHVLHVEDDRIQRSLVAHYLSKQSMNKHVLAQSVVSALARGIRARVAAVAAPQSDLG